MSTILAMLLVPGVVAFTPSTTFGTFGNAEAKALIQAWQPRPLNVPNGEVMLPSSTENMKRFVRARILLEVRRRAFAQPLTHQPRLLLTAALHRLATYLPRTKTSFSWQRSLFPRPLLHPLNPQDANTGCVASFDDQAEGTSLCVILTKFNKAEHQLLMPLWQPGGEASSTFEKLVAWHGERFHEGARLSGKRLEWPDDRAAWAKVVRGDEGI